jgi:glutamate synthase (NADPH/NADH) large chain
MTSGRAVVLGDIGPWACAGMTGGRVYVRVNAFGLDREAIERRLGEGALVELEELDAEGQLDLEDLLGHYAEELRVSDQDSEADRVLELAASAKDNFLQVVPHRVQADPSISTE